jgi:hypothetical protein
MDQSVPERHLCAGYDFEKSVVRISAFAIVRRLFFSVE